MDSNLLRFSPLFTSPLLVYRISSTVHFLIFFFLTILAYGWSLPAIQIILIALLNDAATLAISVDNCKISPRPDKWRLGQLMFLSVVIGVGLTIASFILFFITRDGFGIKLSDERFSTIMYLQISSCPHFMIFGTRATGFFWCVYCDYFNLFCFCSKTFMIC